MKFLFIWARILRTIFVLWALEKGTKEDRLVLYTFGRYIAFRGDVAILESREGCIEVGRVLEVSDLGNSVVLRMYRRPR